MANEPAANPMLRELIQVGFKRLLAPSYARLKRLLAPSYARLFPREWKHRSELRFWRWWLYENYGRVGNSWYEPLYTDVYGLTSEDFKDKRILDIGCGPCGSLEWANMAARRVGLDPLARKYQKLVGEQHKMEYVTARSECIPFPDAYFDVLSCLNALDHVDDFDATVREIKRVVKRGGLFLLSVEIDHPPTATEPIVINDLALRKFGPEFEIAMSFRVGKPHDYNLHRAVMNRSPPYIPGQPGMYVARYARR